MYSVALTVSLVAQLFEFPWNNDWELRTSQRNDNIFHFNRNESQFMSSQIIQISLFYLIRNFKPSKYVEDLQKNNSYLYIIFMQTISTIISSIVPYRHSLKLCGIFFPLDSIVLILRSTTYYNWMISLSPDSVWITQKVTFLWHKSKWFSYSDFSFELRRQLFQKYSIIERKH